MGGDQEASTELSLAVPDVEVLVITPDMITPLRLPQASEDMKVLIKLLMEESMITYADWQKVWGESEGSGYRLPYLDRS